MLFLLVQFACHGSASNRIFQQSGTNQAFHRNPVEAGRARGGTGIIPNRLEESSNMRVVERMGMRFAAAIAVTRTALFDRRGGGG